MMRFSKKFKLTFASLLLAGALASCTHRNEDGNLFVYHSYLKDDVKTLDPANAYDVVSLELLPAFWDSLYQYSLWSSPFKVEPLLAADMPKISADHLTVTIPIKHGVLFQDDPCFKATKGKGRELKAQDFIYSFKRLALPSIQSQGWWIFDGKIVGINAFHDKLMKAKKEEVAKLFEEPIEGLKALDDYTLQIKLTRPYPQLLPVLTMGFTAAVPREAVAAYADEQGNLPDHPVGTGAFVLKHWERGHRLILDKNPTYHTEFYPTTGAEQFRKRGMLADAGKPLPFIDRVVLEVVRERQPQWLGFMKGNYDNIELQKDNFAEAIRNQTNLAPELAAKGMKLSMESGASFYYISFNMQDKLIGGNKVLRQALSAAIDRQKFIDIFTNGTGQKMVNAFTPGMPDRPVDSKIKYDYNPEQAKALLKKAGYPDGKGLPIISFDTRESDSISRQMGDFFQQTWGAIGVKVNVIYNTFPAYLEKAKQGNLQVSYGGWVLDYPDGENIFQLLYGPNKAPGPGEANYDNPEFNKLYERFAIMESSPERQEMATKMDAMVQEDVPWAYLYYHTVYRISQPWLLNYRGSDIITYQYKYLRVNKDVKKRYLEMK